jgi:hypothetical protein
MGSGVRTKLATLLFLIALLLGNGALIGGLEMEAGIPAGCLFAVVCILWWIAYRMSRSVNGRGFTLGFVALGLWILQIAVALVSDFRHYAIDHFLWASAAMLSALVAAIAIFDAPSTTPENVAKSRLPDLPEKWPRQAK